MPARCVAVPLSPPRSPAEEEVSLLCRLVSGFQLHAPGSTVLRSCLLQLRGALDLKWQPRQRWHTRRTRGITLAPCAAASQSQVRNPTEEEVGILEPWPPALPNLPFGKSECEKRTSAAASENPAPAGYAQAARNGASPLRGRTAESTPQPRRERGVQHLILACCSPQLRFA